ncbi:sulfurtransferase complex subunit TusC [Vibrio sp. FNV 38]|nr:sulfurtransferase complex subunit TusC [Vibrio sp. FNV 38]
MKTLGYVFTQAPHGRSSGREGIDALLAASAYCEAIKVFFVGDGVLQLIDGQDPSAVLSKDYAPMLKLFDLYDIDDISVCQTSLAERGCAHADLVINAQFVDQETLKKNLGQCYSILTF